MNPQTKIRCQSSKLQWLIEVKSTESYFPSHQFFIAVVIFSRPLLSWGFAAHRKIVDVAIHHVPEPLHSFLKANREWLVEHALDADLRKHSVIGEAEKHYIDLDEFRTQDSNSVCLPPPHWKDAVAAFGEAELIERGIGPWNIQWQFENLIDAFQARDKNRILRSTADLAHYLSDLHVPLHTSKNYDGALSGQFGIHALWETQVPESRMDEFNLVNLPFIQHWNPQCADSIWQVVKESHMCLDLVFSAEEETMNEIGENNAFAYCVRGRVRQKMRSKAFVELYDNKLGGQVEQRMAKSIQACSIYWYSAWVMAGQPPLPIEHTETSRLRAMIEWIIR
jgi:hypothetical protein